jgi:hypothetical protein
MRKVISLRAIPAERREVELAGIRKASIDGLYQGGVVTMTPRSRARA